MAKKSNEHFRRWRKVNVGCMWGFMGIFDFCQGHSTRRLLSNKKCGSSRNLEKSFNSRELAASKDVCQSNRFRELNNVHFNKPPKSDQIQSKKFQKQSGHYLVRKKDKLTVVYRSNESDDAKFQHKIVILKPSQAKDQNFSKKIDSITSIPSRCNPVNNEDVEQPSSHFLLEDFRGFRNVIGGSRKERLPIAINGILHKIGHITRKNETCCRREHTENSKERRLKSSNMNKIQNKNEFLVTSKVPGRKQISKNAAPTVLFTEAAFCHEARKHIAEFLRIGCESESFAPIQVSKSLGRIISFPEYSYKEAESLQKKITLSLYRSKQEDSAENFKLLGPKKSFLSTDKKQETKSVTSEIVEVDDEKCINNEDVSQLEARSILIIGKESTGLLESEESEEISETLTPSTSFLSSFVAIQEAEDTECVVENSCRPSPISVLEPFFFEDVSYPAKMISEHATDSEAKTQPIEYQIDEAGLIICPEFDEALLFDELEISYSMFIDDRKLLFDSIDEVVTEIKERHLNCTPWVYLMRPTIWSVPKQEYFMKEACRRINWNLDVQFPSTLKQAVQKDLDGSTWFDFQVEGEIAVGEIEYAILDYLFEETVLELWF